MYRLENETYIKNLISQGENINLDFKYTINDSKKIAKTLSAFANTKGGRLLIGVKDNGNIAGVKTEEDYYMIEAAAQIYCKPEIKFKSKEWNIEGKEILEITISESNDKPHFAINEEKKEIAFIRVADENIIANIINLKVWDKEKREKGLKIKYSETENILLKYLEKNENISLLNFMKVAKISRHKAIETLSDLIVLQLIDCIYINKKPLFKLK
ncbi:MAG: ATP-binding protein [Bacteroidales bacterium]|nr:ATP-binding protein [Bacteroidales bacterium]